MWFGACTSSVGTWMQKVAQSWLVLEISGSSFWLGLDAFLGEIPIFLFSLVGGVVADRVERRFVLLASQILQMSCAFLLAILIGTGIVEIWHILVLSFMVGTAQAFGGPAYQALIPTLVERDDLPNAIALNSIQFNLARVIGPILGGLALTQLGAVWCFALNGVSYIAVIVSLMMLRVRFIPAKTVETFMDSVKEGISFVRKQGTMEALIVLAFLMTALGIPMITFLPVFAKNVFQGGPTVFTIFLSCLGAGSVAGALVVAAYGNIKRKGMFAILLLICMGVGIAGFALSTSLVASCILLFLSGACTIAVFSMVSSLVQLITNNEMRGRVMSVYNVAFRGGSPIGSLVTGYMMPIFTAPTVLAWNGVLLLGIGLYFLLVQRRVAAL
jgi:predicted MFS family arabinose efflux permease